MWPLLTAVQATMPRAKAGEAAAIPARVLFALVASSSEPQGFSQAQSRLQIFWSWNRAKDAHNPPAGSLLSIAPHITRFSSVSRSSTGPLSATEYRPLPLHGLGTTMPCPLPRRQGRTGTGQEEVLYPYRKLILAIHLCGEPTRTCDYSLPGDWRSYIRGQDLQRVRQVVI